ncbi:MAG: nucleotidyltransferase domain-containing protein [Ilumatobacteraceae bacterium]
MDISSPISSVIPGVPGVILQVLARTTQPLTGSGIADLVAPRWSRAGVTKALHGLVESGLVTCMPAGRANLYTLNREHVAATPVLELSHLRATLIDRISAAVRAWPTAATAVYVYGSLARSSGNSSSDIDLLVVRPRHVRESNEKWSSQLIRLTDNVHEWSGNHCEILEYTVVELQRLVKRKDALILSLRRDAQLIAGQRVRGLLEPR